MAENPERIEQFQKMAEADPTNELGHFSLGRALLDDGQFDPAAAAFRKVIDLNPNISKAYQLLGDTLTKQNDTGAAVEVYTTGVKIAAARGDVMPRNEMSARLKELGAAVPEVASTTPAMAVGEGEVLCKRCGTIQPRLPKPPLPNDFGKDIFENIGAPCWREAIGHGTKVINELRLPLADPQAQKIWDQHIREFLNL